jgi:hypothetical protein
MHSYQENDDSCITAHAKGNILMRFVALSVASK